jgi:dCTP deaminase
LKEGFIRVTSYHVAVGLLSDADILQYRAKGEIEIEPFDPEHLTPNGYDVSVDEVVVPAGRGRPQAGKIPPATRFAVSTRERVRLGRHVAGQIWLRTTWARRGVVASFGMIDAGFSGTLTFGAFNASSEPLALPIGDRFAQVVFLTLESRASETYEQRSGTYQGQKGVTLERP